MIVPIQDWATADPERGRLRARRQPNINAVIIAFDGMTAVRHPALVEKHAGLKIYTWGGGRSVVKLMEAGEPVVVADPAPDEQWDAYEAMDQVIRLLGGQPAASVNNEIDPNRFCVPSNVKRSSAQAAATGTRATAATPSSTASSSSGV